MPIKGLTDRGLAFPEIGQIRKGAPKGDRAPGKDLTYFRVEFDEREVKAAEQFRQVYGDQPTAIRIILPFNDLSRMWDAWLEAYTAGRMIARSDGEWVQYQINGQTGEILVMNGKDTKTGEPVAHPRDDVAGYDFKKNAIKYKASGRLKVIIPELGRAAYLTVLTTSKHDIANISAQLAAFAEINRGQIAGIPFILRRKPKKISMPGQTPGQRVRVVKWMLSIEADPDWVKAKLGELNTAALPAGVVHALPPGPVDDEGFEQVEGEIEDDELDTTGFEVPYQAEPPQPPDQDEPEAPIPSRPTGQRPYTPEVARQGIIEKAAKVAGFTPSEKQVGLLVHALELCFVGDDHAEQKRHSVLGWLNDGHESAKKVSGSMFKVIIEQWLKLEKDSGGAYKVDPLAASEARAMATVYELELAIAQGQQPLGI